MVEKASSFFKLIIEKTFFDHNPGYFEYFTTFNILKCIELNSLQLMLSLLVKMTKNNAYFKMFRIIGYCALHNKFELTDLLEIKYSTVDRARHLKKENFFLFQRF